MTHPFESGSHVFAYLRDSGHEKQELSISQQETAIRTWCIENNLILQHIYKDEARPGSSIVGRTELNSMMNAFRHGAEVAGVVVWKYNRFARNIDNAQFLRAEIRTRGYILHSINDHIPNGPEAIIFEALIDYTDQQYLTNLSIDVKRGLHNLVKEFGCVPGTPPTGFKREKVIISQHRDGTPRIAHRWVPDEDLAFKVKEAFEMRASGASLGQINEKTRLFSSINSYASFWKNKLYIGTLIFGDLIIENYCTPIVDQKTFELVQARQQHFAGGKHMTGGTIDHPQRVASTYLLSGLAHCSRCGSPLFGTTSKQRNGSVMRSYFCSRAYRNRDCTRQRIPISALETAVISALRDRILKPDYLQAVIEAKRTFNASHQSDYEAQRRQLAKDLAETRREIKNTTNAIRKRPKSNALLESLDELEKQETSILTDMTKLEAAHANFIPEVNVEKLKAQISKINLALASADIQTQRAALRGLIKHISVDRTKNKLFGVVTINIPTNSDNEPPSEDPNNPKPPSKPPLKTVRKGTAPSGPPSFTHSFTIVFDLREADKRRKKSHSI